MWSSIHSILLASAAASAVLGSSTTPFVLFSTSKLPSVPDTLQLQTSNQVLASAKELLSACPTEQYLLISQPNMHAGDIRSAPAASADQCAMPNLCRAVRGAATQSRFSVAEVLGQVETAALAEHVRTSCAARGVKEPRVEVVELRHLPSAREGNRRAKVLEQNDLDLGRLLDSFAGDYTVLFYSDPNDAKSYEPEFQEPVHMDLKRQEDSSLLGTRAKNTTDNLPLFEKYQFFTPSVFTGLITLIILLSILGAGLSAVSDLKVPYGAFEKEMGPSVYKKQQ